LVLLVHWWKAQVSAYQYLQLLGTSPNWNLISSMFKKWANSIPYIQMS
jgi:hypothetical protein